MNFVDLANRIQSDIQSLPLETIGYQFLESKNHSSVRILDLIDSATKDCEQPLKQRLKSEFEGLGPIEELSKDQEITEILINSFDQIWFEKNGQLFSHHDQFANELTYKNFIERICQTAGVIVNIEKPFSDGKFGQFRIHIGSHAPTYGKFQISLRRQNQNPWSLSELEKIGWANSNNLETIRSWIKTRKNFLVIGETSSGKTSVLNACLKDLAHNDRCVVLEDTDEISIPNLVSTKLLTRFDSNGVLPSIDLSDILKQSLRMRPDRLVIGEVRGAEAKDLLLALSTGHQGSMGTLHAGSAHQALMRLEMLVQIGAPQWSLTTIRRLIALSLHGILMVGRDENGRRKLKSIHQIASLEETGILLENIFQEDLN